MAAPNKAEIAWAAGFFEGEGYFSGIIHNLARGRRRRYAYVGINNTDLKTLVRFQTIVGVGEIRSRKADTVRFKAKPQWRWLVCNRAGVEHVYNLFKPWLSEERLRKAHAALEREVDPSPEQLALH